MPFNHCRSLWEGRRKCRIWWRLRWFLHSPIDYTAFPFMLEVGNKLAVSSLDCCVCTEVASSYLHACCVCAMQLADSVSLIRCDITSSTLNWIQQLFLAETHCNTLTCYAVFWLVLHKSVCCKNALIKCIMRKNICNWFGHNILPRATCNLLIATVNSGRL